jgi:hypothetical protein
MQDTLPEARLALAYISSRNLTTADRPKKAKEKTSQAPNNTL